MNEFRLIQSHDQSCVFVAEVHRKDGAIAGLYYPGSGQIDLMEPTVAVLRTRIEAIHRALSLPVVQQRRTGSGGTQAFLYEEPTSAPA